MKDPLFLIAAATGGFMLSLAVSSIVHATPVISLKLSPYQTLRAASLQQPKMLGAASSLQQPKMLGATSSLQQSKMLGATSSLQQPIYIDERGSCTLMGD